MIERTLHELEVKHAKELKTSCMYTVPQELIWKTRPKNKQKKKSYKKHFFKYSDNQILSQINLKY